MNLVRCKKPHYVLFILIFIISISIFFRTLSQPEVHVSHALLLATEMKNCFQSHKAPPFHAFIDIAVFEDGYEVRRVRNANLFLDESIIQECILSVASHQVPRDYFNTEYCNNPFEENIYVELIGNNEEYIGLDRGFGCVDRSLSYEKSPHFFSQIPIRSALHNATSPEDDLVYREVRACDQYLGNDHFEKTLIVPIKQTISYEEDKGRQVSCSISMQDEEDYSSCVCGSLSTQAKIIFSSGSGAVVEQHGWFIRHKNDDSVEFYNTSYLDRISYIEEPVR